MSTRRCSAVGTLARRPLLPCLGLRCLDPRWLASRRSLRHRFRAFRRCWGFRRCLECCCLRLAIHPSCSRRRPLHYRERHRCPSCRPCLGKRRRRFRLWFRRMANRHTALRGRANGERGWARNRMNGAREEVGSRREFAASQRRGADVSICYCRQKCCGVVTTREICCRSVCRGTSRHGLAPGWPRSVEKIQPIG